MIVFHGTMKVKPGTRDEFVKKLVDARFEERFRAQQGNVFYTLALSATDDDVVVTCDAWQTKEDFEAHGASSDCKEFIAIHDEYVIEDREPNIFEF